MDKQLYGALSTVLSKRFGIDAEDLSATTTFSELGFDSMDFVTLAVELEKDGVELDEGRLTLEHTLAESVALLARLP